MQKKRSSIEFNVSKLKTFPIILEYCGGKATEKLYKKLSRDNPNYKIHVLDNASPINRCDSKIITHQNTKNSFVGGGIKDCIRLAKKNGCKYIFFFVNDVVIKNTINIEYFENLMESDGDIVQASASLTKDSDKNAYYPWMTNTSGKKDRLVNFSDLLACILRIDFLDKIDFPNMKSAWGYDWEIAFYAKLNNKKIMICDNFLCEHTQKTDKWEMLNAGFDKWEEATNIYNEKYGNFQIIHPNTGQIYKDNFNHTQILFTN